MKLPVKKKKMKDQDALYVERWLLDRWGDIINLCDQFRAETGWKQSRIDNAFYLVWTQSEKVGW